MLIFARDFAGVAQLVEHDLAKVGVAGSSLVFRSKDSKPVVWNFLFMAFPGVFTAGKMMMPWWRNW